MDQTPTIDESNLSPLALIIFACCFWVMTREFLSVQQKISAGYHQKLRYWIKTSLGTTSFQDLITLMPPSSCFWIVGHIIGRMYCTFVILYTMRPLEQFSINFLLYFFAKNMCYNDCDWLWCCNVPTWSVGVFAGAESIRGLRFYKKILWAACRAVWYFVECWSLLPIVFGLAFTLVIQLQSWGRSKLFATSCSEKKQSYFIILKYDLWDMQLAITMDLFLPFFFYRMSWQICCIYVVFHNSIVWFMKEFEKSLLWSIGAIFVARGFDRTEVFEVV